MEVKSRKKILPWLIATAVIAFLVAGVLLLSSMDRYTFREEAYYPLMGTDYPIRKGDTATIPEDGTCAQLTLESGTVEGSENVAFFTDRKALLSLGPWELVERKLNDSASFWRISAFTEVQATGNTQIFSRNNESKIGNGVFLYNGEDSFVLLQDAVLTYGEQTVELPAFSWLAASYGNWVQYRNYADGTYVMDVNGEQDVWLDFTSAGIRVQPDLDLMFIDGTECMLISTLSFLDDYMD